MSEIAIFSGFEAERWLGRGHCLHRVQSTCMGVTVSTYCQFLKLLGMKEWYESRFTVAYSFPPYSNAFIDETAP